MDMDVLSQQISHIEDLLRIQKVYDKEDARLLTPKVKEWHERMLLQKMHAYEAAKEAEAAAYRAKFELDENATEKERMLVLELKASLEKRKELEETLNSSKVVPEEDSGPFDLKIKLQASLSRQRELEETLQMVQIEPHSSPTIGSPSGADVEEMTRKLAASVERQQELEASLKALKVEKMSNQADANSSEAEKLAERVLMLENQLRAKELNMQNYTPRSHHERSKAQLAKSVERQRELEASLKSIQVEKKAVGAAAVVKSLSPRGEILRLAFSGEGQDITRSLPTFGAKKDSEQERSHGLSNQPLQ